MVVKVTEGVHNPAAHIMDCPYCLVPTHRDLRRLASAEGKAHS
jgi:hypothetical protein